MKSKTVTFEIADMTDPRVLAACGLRRQGRYFVTDDADAEVVGEYTAREMKLIVDRELKRLKKAV